jgi:hypothetical protein
MCVFTLSTGEKYDLPAIADFRGFSASAKN